MLLMATLFPFVFWSLASPLAAAARWRQRLPGISTRRSLIPPVAFAVYRGGRARPRAGREPARQAARGPAARGAPAAVPLKRLATVGVRQPPRVFCRWPPAFLASDRHHGHGGRARGARPLGAHRDLYQECGRVVFVQSRRLPRPRRAWLLFRGACAWRTPGRGSGRKGGPAASALRARGRAAAPAALSRLPPPRSARRGARRRLLDVVVASFLPRAPRLRRRPAGGERRRLARGASTERGGGRRGGWPGGPWRSR